MLPTISAATPAVNVNFLALTAEVASVGPAILVLFRGGSPSADDVPRGNTLPAFPTGSQGTWSGSQGDSDWTPNKPIGQQIMQSLTNGGQTTVAWSHGYPNFGPFVFHQAPGFALSAGTVDIGAQHGTSGDGQYDFNMADTSYARSVGWFLPDGVTPDTARVRSWRRSYSQSLPNGSTAQQLTWHHKEDMKTMQLVFSEFNDGTNIRHQGGAFFAKKARW